MSESGLCRRRGVGSLSESVVCVAEEELVLWVRVWFVSQKRSWFSEWECGLCRKREVGSLSESLVCVAKEKLVLWVRVCFVSQKRSWLVSCQTTWECSSLRFTSSRPTTCACCWSCSRPVTLSTRCMCCGYFINKQANILTWWKPVNSVLFFVIEEEEEEEEEECFYSTIQCNTMIRIKDIYREQFGQETPIKMQLASLS